MVKSRKVSRRAALKVIIAAGVGGALTTLPNRWVKPLIEIGALPAHAQLSRCSSTISNLLAESQSGACGLVPDGEWVRVTFDYSSPVGIVSFVVRANLPASEWDTISGTSIVDPNNGSLIMDLCVDMTNNPGATVTVVVTQSDGGRCRDTTPILPAP